MRRLLYVSKREELQTLITAPGKLRGGGGGGGSKKCVTVVTWKQIFFFFFLNGLRSTNRRKWQFSVRVLLVKEKVPLIGGVGGGGLDEKLSVFKVTQKSNITIKHVSD